MTDIIDYLANVLTIEQLYFIIFVMFGAMFIYIGVKIYKSIKWWKASKNYVNNDMKIGDEVHFSTSDTGKEGRVLKIDKDTIDVVVTVYKSNVYLKYEDFRNRN